MKEKQQYFCGLSGLTKNWMKPLKFTACFLLTDTKMK